MFNYADRDGRWRGYGLEENCPEGCTPIAGEAPAKLNDIWNGEAWTPDVAAAIAARCLDVDNIRDGKFAAGMPYGGKMLQLRDVDQQRITASGAAAKFSLLTGAAWPGDFGWIMADNSVLTLDAAGMSAMADAAAAQVRAWILNGHAHKSALRAFAMAGDVAAYDIDAGW